MGAEEQRPEESTRRVIVTDFDMSFTNMVWFMVKWVLASIPALLVLATLVAILALAARSILSIERNPPSFDSDTQSPSAETAINEAAALLLANKASEAYGKSHAALATMAMSTSRKAACKPSSRMHSTE